MFLPTRTGGWQCPLDMKDIEPIVQGDCDVFGVDDIRWYQNVTKFKANLEFPPQIELATGTKPKLLSACDWFKSQTAS